MRDVIEAAGQRFGLLSDGRFRLRWHELPTLVDRVQQALDARGLDPLDPLVLEAPASVPGAVTLLALMARRTTVVLIPPTQPLAPTSSLPRFARHRVRIAPEPAAELDPAAFLTIHPIDDHRPLPAHAPLRRDRLVLRTSGSVDRPKHVVHTHQGLLANASSVIDRLRLRPSDRVLIPVPLAHMYGLGAAFLPSLEVGASVDLLEGANLLRYLERERSVRPTVAFLTPNLCLTLLRPRASTEGYRHVVVAGDALDPAARARAEQIFRRVVALYGSTELGAICAVDAEDPDHASPARASTAGRPLPGVELRLRDTHGNAETKGELLCARPHGLEGYVDELGHPSGEPVAPWFPTRDLVRLHPDGSVEVLGRIDHAVKRDGRLVMLRGVERALVQLGAERAAAIVAGQTHRGRGIVAFYSLHEGTTLAPDRLRGLCRDVLPAYAVPDELHLLPALPVLPSGKLDRVALHQTLRASGPAPGPS